MADFSIKQNDTRPILELHLTLNGSPLDLTGAASVKLLMASTPGGATTVTRPGTITTPASGITQFTFQAADTATVGMYNAEVEITWSAGAIETVPNADYISIEIVDDLG